MKRFFLMTAALALCAAAAIADDGEPGASRLVTGENPQCFDGQRVALPVMLESGADITAIQCDITLPEGITLATGDEGEYLIEPNAERMGDGHAVSARQVSNGAVRMVLATPSSAPFAGESGDVLFTLWLDVEQGLDAGEYALTIDRIIMADVLATQYRADAITPAVEVRNCIPGDVNDDGTVDMGDYVAVVNYILENDPQPFVFIAADLNNDNEIDVSDLVAVANIALHWEDNPAPEAGAPENGPRLTAGSNALPSLNAAMNGNDLVLSIAAAEPLAAMQADVWLPEGMSVSGATLPGTSGYGVTAKRLATGKWRVLVSSPAARVMPGKVLLHIDGDARGDALVSGIVVARPDASALHLSPAVTAIGTTGAAAIASDQTSITANGASLVINSPVAATALVTLANGATTTLPVAAGINTYEAPAPGVVIVKVGDTVAKLLF